MPLELRNKVYECQKIKLRERKAKYPENIRRKKFGFTSGVYLGSVGTFRCQPGIVRGAKVLAV